MVIQVCVLILSCTCVCLLEYYLLLHARLDSRAVHRNTHRGDRCRRGFLERTVAGRRGSVCARGVGPCSGVVRRPLYAILSPRLAAALLRQPLRTSPGLRPRHPIVGGENRSKKTIFKWHNLRCEHDDYNDAQQDTAPTLCNRRIDTLSQ